MQDRPLPGTPREPPSAPTSCEPSEDVSPHRPGARRRALEAWIRRVDELLAGRGTSDLDVADGQELRQHRNEFTVGV
jgi:hypothetical protein